MRHSFAQARPAHPLHGTCKCWVPTYRPPSLSRCGSLVPSAHAGTATSSRENLLEAFWEARGVFDSHRRAQLIRIAKELRPTGDDDLLLGGTFCEEAGAALTTQTALPGVPTTWSINTSTPEVVEVSRRLVALHALLGGQDDIDVIWMVVREPELLKADYSELMRRLLQMKLASAGTPTDIVKVVERQPSLLLMDDTPWDDLETLQQRLSAWEFGLTSDSDPEWQRRYNQLCDYHRQHGDCSVGYREADDPELARWANKQRQEHKQKSLGDDKTALLQELAFEFDEDEAEWLRWFLELARFKEWYGHASPMPLAAGVDFYLINWCSVQRVAYRCKLLSPRRLALLESIEFDWSGADPLS